MNTYKKAEQIGRQAWLASLGAYGAGWRYAVEKFDKTYTQTNAIVNELISSGEKIESELQRTLKSTALLNSKIDALKSKLGLNDTSESERLAKLDAQVDALIEIVAGYAESKKPKAVTKPKKTTVKKIVAKKAKS